MKITTKIAADVIGKPEQFVRLGLQQGRLPIGTAVKGKRWSYDIQQHLLEAYAGKDRVREVLNAED